MTEKQLKELLVRLEILTGVMAALVIVVIVVGVMIAEAITA